MQQQQHILQVSELTKKVRFILENEINRVWLCGEISNFVAASSGHWYLSLKDSKSQIRCAMFKGANRNVRLTPRNGQQVLVRAKVSLYEPRGDFQLIIEQMEDAGEGLLRQKYEQLKQQLNAEGLFAQFNKKSIPTHIKTVGVVTSPTGAAVKDILTVLRRRNPTINVIIYPAIVQGQQGTSDIVHAINVANERAECDVLIVGRGGGSLEDLWNFNEEAVVRAIYQGTIPVISAVGHEIDTTLCDYVADLRVATPSAAAELVSQGNGISGATIGVPFPIPSNGLEVIWNHILRYRGVDVETYRSQAAPTSTGAYTLVENAEEIRFEYTRPEITLDKLKETNTLFYFKKQTRLTASSYLCHSFHPSSRRNKKPSRAIGNR
mgnify:CR=1 FL=1